MFSIVNATTVGFAYLITILLLAASWGLGASVVASILATVCFNYFFLPPIGKWAIADPENWVALFTFLISSLIASELSDRARRRTAEANAGKIEMERLYALSRAMMLIDGSEPIGDQIAKELARICEIPAVAIYDSAGGKIHRAGIAGMPGVDARLTETALSGAQSKDEETRTLFASISLGGQSIGSVAIRGGELSDTALHAVLNLTAISLDNALKYSPQRSAVQISTRSADENFMIIVRNQGETISESERARVFDKFYRGQNVRHQVAGTGMGLPVARDILLAHGGDIYLHSSNQDGTEFVMAIPRDSTEPADSRSAAKQI